jgi:hypothetical protein
MKRAFLIIVIFLGSLGLRSQAPILEFDAYLYDECSSNIISLGSKAFINCISQFYNSSTNEHHGFNHQIIIDQNGNILVNKVLDTTAAYGHNTGMNAFILKDSFLYQFGCLISKDVTYSRLFIRKTDLNLNLIKDTILNFNNSFIMPTDVIWDSSAFLLSGYLYSQDTSLAFVLKITEDFQILDSLGIPLYQSYWYDMGFFSFPTGELNLFITSYYTHNDLMLRIDRQTLQITDTLHIRGFDSPHSTYEYKNCYGSFLNDSTLLTPIEIFQEVYPLDSLFKLVGWLMWDKNGNILDTLMPYRDTIMADRIGIRKTMLIQNDTIVMAYSHNSVWYGISDTSECFALIFADLQGNPLNVNYFSGGSNLTVENIARFENGNYLVLGQRVDTDNPIPKYSFGLIGYLFNSQGDLLQSIDFPKPVSTQLSLYPNPTSGLTQVKCKEWAHGKWYHINLYDSNGNLVETQNLPVEENGFQLDLSRYSAGMYYLTIQNSTGKLWKGKILKQ